MRALEQGSGGTVSKIERLASLLDSGEVKWAELSDKGKAAYLDYAIQTGRIKKDELSDKGLGLLVKHNMPSAQDIRRTIELAQTGRYTPGVPIEEQAPKPMTYAAGQFAKNLYAPFPITNIQAPRSGAEQALGFVTGTAGMLASPLMRAAGALSKLAPAAGGAIRLGTLSAGQQAQRALSGEDVSAKEALSNIAISAAVGGVSDILAPIMRTSVQNTLAKHFPETLPKALDKAVPYAAPVAVGATVGAGRAAARNVGKWVTGEPVDISQAVKEIGAEAAVFAAVNATLAAIGIVPKGSTSDYYKFAKKLIEVGATPENRTFLEFPGKQGIGFQYDPKTATIRYQFETVGQGDIAVPKFMSETTAISLQKPAVPQSPPAPSVTPSVTQNVSPQASVTLPAPQSSAPTPPQLIVPQARPTTSRPLAAIPTAPAPVKVAVPQAQPSIVKPAIKVGDTVYSNGTPLTVVNASDPSLLTVKNEQGTTLKIGRGVVTTQPSTTQPAVQTPAKEVAATKVETAKAEPAKTEVVAKKEDKPVPDLPIAVSPNDISYDTAYNAHRWNSMVPDERAKGIQNEYVQHIREIYDELKSLAETDAQRDILRDELERYKQGYLKHMNAILAARSRTASSMVTGPANFPTRRNQKALESEMQRYDEMRAWQGKAISSIRRKLKGTMTAEQTTSKEFERLKRDIDETIATLKGIETGEMRGLDPALFKSSLAGKIQRSHDAAAVKDALEYLRKTQNEVLSKPAFTDRHSIWSFVPKEAAIGQGVILEREGVRVVNNGDIDRVQIFLDDKPSAELRNALKSAGWKWSPKNSAWQRKRTANALSSAKRIVGEHMTATEVSPDHLKQVVADNVEAFAPRLTIPKGQPVTPAKKASLSTLPQQRKIYADGKAKGLSRDAINALVKERYGVDSTKELTKQQASALIDEMQTPVEIKPVSKPIKASPLKFAEMITNPSLFRDISEVSPAKPSLLRDELALLPKDLRDKVTKLDNEAGMVNQQIRKLLAMNNTEVPGDLKGADAKKYDTRRKWLEEIDAKRNILRPEILKVLDAKGKVGATVLKRIESDELADIVPITMSSAEEGLRRAEGLPEGVVGYMWKSPIEEQTLFIPPVPAPTNALEVMLSKPVNIYTALLEPVRDLFGEEVVRPWRNASRQYNVFVNEYEKILRQAFRPLAENPQARERVQLMLEGELKISGTEGAIARQLRKSFYGSDQNSALFREFGIDPERYIKEYAPRVRKSGSAEKAFPQGVPQKLKFFAEEERTGNLMPRETDALQTAIMYLRAGAKKKFFDPVVEQLQPYVDQMHPDRRFIYEQFSNSVLGRPVLEERMCNELIRAIANPLLKRFGKEVTGRPSQSASAFVTDLGYLGTVGFNVFSAVKNLSQQLLVVSHLSEKYPLEGLKWVLKAKAARLTPTGKELLKYNWVGQHRIYLEGVDLQYRVIEKFMGPVRKAGYFLFSQADRDNVNTAYLAGTMKALAEGKSMDEAVELGNMTAASTQYLYGIDSPMLFKGPLGRQLGMLASWPLNFMRLLWEQGTSDTKHRVLTSLVTMAVGSYVLSKLTGLSFRSIHPWETAKSWLPSSWMSGQRSLTVEAAYNAIEVMKARLEGNDPELVEEALDALKDSLSTFIPAKVQLDRIAKFIDAAKNEWKVYDSRGRLRYEITPGEAVRGLFGPTVESQKRYEESRSASQKLQAYSKLRQSAIDAYFKKDMEKFHELQAELTKLRKPITAADLKREIQLRQQTSLERQEQSLPPSLRSK